MKTTVNLSPPWYTLQKEVYNTIGLTPGVNVGDLKTGSLPYVIPIEVDDRDKAQCLANILTPSHYSNGLTVNIEVMFDGSKVQPETEGSPENLAEMVRRAFEGSPIFETVEIRELMPYGPIVVWPVFTKNVIQFSNDDVSDFFLNYNEVTANIMKNILVVEFSKTWLYPSTSENS